MLLDAFALSQPTLQPICHAQERAGASVLEDMQTPLEHLISNRDTGFLDAFKYLAHMFCGMGEIQDAQRVRPMSLGKGLAPVGPVRDDTDLLCLFDPAPLHLSVCQLSKGGGIGEARKVRELTNVDLWFSFGLALLLWLPDGQGAHFDPLLVE